MLSQFDLVIFDCDGVLIDSEMLSCGCLQEMLCAHGLPIDLEGVFERFLGRSFSTVEEVYRDALGRPLAEGFRASYKALLKARFSESLRPMPGIELVLAGLDRPSCVASSSDVERLAFSLAAAGLSGHFGDRAYSADLVARAKPAPDLFLYAAGRMRATPPRTLVVEDSVTGVLAGKAAGMAVWGFVGGSHHAGRDGAGALTAAGADRIVRGMADFWQT